MFIACYIQTTGFYFPHANLQSIEISEQQTIKLANPTLWSKIEKFDVHKQQMSVPELYQAIEYLAICGQGKQTIHHQSH